MDADRAVAQEPRSKPESPPEGYEHFFRNNYTALMVTAMHAGPTSQEADDVAAKTMDAALARWSEIDNPRGWARRAVVRLLVMAK